MTNNNSGPAPQPPLPPVPQPPVPSLIDEILLQAIHDQRLKPTGRLPWQPPLSASREQREFDQLKASAVKLRRHPDADQLERAAEYFKYEALKRRQFWGRVGANAGTMGAVLLVITTGFGTLAEAVKSGQAIILALALFFIGQRLDHLQEVYAYAEALSKMASKLPADGQAYIPLQPFKRKNATTYLERWENLMVAALAAAMILVLVLAS